MIIKDTEAAKKCFIARKSGLLGSVAAFGLLALGVGAAPAQSAAGAPTEAAAVVQPVGFADLVTKVKPAVISVRVKMDQPSANVPSAVVHQNRIVICYLSLCSR